MWPAGVKGHQQGWGCRTPRRLFCVIVNFIWLVFILCFLHISYDSLNAII